MKQSGITRIFILVCAAVLFAAYAAGLGVRKIRGVDAPTPAVAAVETEKPAGEPESDEDEVVANADISSEPSEEWPQGHYEEEAEESTARPERPGGGAQMVVTGLDERRAMGERFRSMAGEERARKELEVRRAKTDEENLRRVQEAWPDMDEETRGKIRGIMERWPTMSEEQRDYHRAGNID